MSFFNQLKKSINDALSGAGLGFWDINEVLLVGGSSRIPYVRNWLGTYFYKQPIQVLDDDQGIAFGATLVAADLIRGDDIQEQIARIGLNQVAAA